MTTEESKPEMVLEFAETDQQEPKLLQPIQRTSPTQPIQPGMLPGQERLLKWGEPAIFHGPVAGALK